MNKNQRWTALFSIIFCGLITVDYFWIGALSILDHKIQDTLVHWHAGKISADPDIVIVDIDADALNELETVYGRYPFPRSIYADLLRHALKQNPKAVVLDIIFSGADPHGEYNDEDLTQVAIENKNLFFATLFNGTENTDKVYQAALLQRQKLDRQDQNERPFIILQDEGERIGFTRLENASPIAIAEFMRPIAGIENTQRTGIVNFLPDKQDGIGRSYLSYKNLYGWRFPSLPVRLAEFLGYEIPPGDIRIHWKGGPYSHPHIPLHSLLEDAYRKNPLRPQNELTNKIIVIGSTAPILGDFRITPLDKLHPGVEILAMTIDNLKNAEFMKPLDRYWLSISATMLVGMLMIAFHWRTGLIVATIVGILASGSLVAVQYIGITRLYHIPVTASIVVGFGYFFVVAIYRYLQERKDRLNTITLFSRFLDPIVVNDLVNQSVISPELKAERSDITVLFTDIRNFTTLSESHAPEEIVNFLNRYFGQQVETIFQHGGTLDKFIGDAIMAFWGAPLKDTQQAKHAVACALNMAKNLSEYDIDIGIGVHSGPAVVGFIGSQERRMEYTAIGDTVNLASRVEGQTKRLARVLVSGETRELCKDSFDFVDHGSYKVKGRSQEVRLFEPKRKTV